MPLKQRNILPRPVIIHEELADMDSNITQNLTTSPPYPSNFTTVPISGNTTDVPVALPPCQWILHHEIGNSHVRVWDVIILIPNAIFLLFLLVKLRTTYAKLKHTNSPIFFTFYIMVFVVAVISVLRCVVSMTVNATVPAGDITDKLLWLLLRFFLLATEMSVIVFGLAFGHLDSKTSIRRVMLVTSLVAMAYSVTQGTLEFLQPDQRFHVTNASRDYDIFGHGGMMFWFISSIFFCIVYLVIFLLPYTKLKQRFALPPKRSFYWYCLFLACLNLTQAVGSGMLFWHQEPGLCVVDFTTYVYFTCFAPLVYLTFLRDFFRNSQPPTILFSYKAQVDEPGDEDQLSLPHQTHNSVKPEELNEAQINSLYDSTHFEDNSPNPLYNADVPGSFDSAVLSINTDREDVMGPPRSIKI